MLPMAASATFSPWPTAFSSTLAGAWFLLAAVSKIAVASSTRPLDSSHLGEELNSDTTATVNDIMITPGGLGGEPGHEEQDHHDDDRDGNGELEVVPAGEGPGHQGQQHVGQGPVALQPDAHHGGRPPPHNLHAVAEAGGEAGHGEHGHQAAQEGEHSHGRREGGGDPARQQPKRLGRARYRGEGVVLEEMVRELTEIRVTRCRPNLGVERV